MPLVARTRDVRMTFDGYTSLALTDVNLEVRRGEIMGLIGPKDCGKSTALRLLAGRLRPTEGKVEVFGHSPRRSSVRARIGYLPQHPRLAREGGTFGWLRNWFQSGPRKRNETSESALSNIPAVTHLLFKKPDLAILDEPFAGLDSAACGEMRELIVNAARQGTTVVLSSNSILLAKEMCHRMAIFFRGQIQAVGSLDELLATPDAIRVIGPVLPTSTADRILTAIREEMLGNNCEASAAGETPKAQAVPANFQTRAKQIFNAPTPRSEPADTVNHAKLAQLTKPHSDNT